MQLLSTLSAELNENTDSSNKPIYNTQAFKVHFFPKQYIIETNQKQVKISKYLVINRENGNISEQDQITQQSEQQRSFSAFLGTINILDKAFLLLVDGVNQICGIDTHDIFEIQSIAFLPYEPETTIYASVKASEILNMINHLKKLLMMGFYYSYTYDLTLSKIKQQIQYPTEIKFLWNINLIKEYLKSNIDRRWTTFLIQGFVGYFDLYVNGKRLDFHLLSRRSSRRAGTRYNSRGIDDDGNVSNYVETEQIIYYNNICCSHLQIRGSVPLFWTQRGYLTETKLLRTPELCKASFKKHFQDVCQDYSRVIILNLMNKKKTGEQLLTEAFEEQIKQNNLPNVKYEWFDFHHECKNSTFSNSNPLIRKQADHVKNFSFYMEDMKTKQVQQIQHGIFRTNCLDCLDRTNFVQAKIAMTAFDIQMKAIGVDFSQILKMSPIEALDEESNKGANYFIQYFKNIWADNGDMLSAQYTGTGSTHTNITRTGRRDVSGMIDHGTKSLMRFYIQNFSDNVKQEAIDVLLGVHTDTVNKFTTETERQLKTRQKEYCDYSERSILVVTWNLGGAPIPGSYDLNKQIIDHQADIVVFGLQEMMPSGTALMVGTTQALKQWDELIFSNLNQKEKYIQIKSKELLGIGLFIYAKDRFKDRITKVSYDTVKLGFLGQVANKGAVVVKMNLDDTLICFANCHYEHGQKSLTTRVTNLSDVHSQAFNTIGIGKRKEEKIEQCDYRIMFGDLNFRINLEADKAITQIQRYKLFTEQGRNQEAKEILSQLLKLDELNIIKQSNIILKRYFEPDVQFLPTYKYEAYSNLYDKNRTPSWTDRILIAENSGMESKYLFYKSHDVNYSDHRPVSALITVKTWRENEQRKDIILKEIYAKDLGLGRQDEYVVG